MGGLFETDPETGARRPRVPLLPRLETVLSPSMPPADEITPPTAAAPPPPLAPQPAGDVSEPRRPDSPGRLASILASTDDSPVGAPSAMPVAERRQSPQSSRLLPYQPRTEISVEFPKYKIGPAGTQFIKDEEARGGPRLTVYTDTAGYQTIGYGHKLRPGEAELFRHGIDKETAERLLTGDLETAEAAVHRLVRAPITQQQHDALVSFTFNFGARKLAGSTILRELNGDHPRQAADAFLLWNKERKNGTLVPSKGLTARRQRERDLFLDGLYR